MTCVFKALIRGLGLCMSPAHFVQKVQDENRLTPTITWNKQSLTQQQQEENFDSVAALDLRLLRQGYDTSSCDPLLFLVAELFEVNIHHEFQGIVFLYENKKSHPTIRLSSSNDHMELESTILRKQKRKPKRKQKRAC